MQRKLLSPLIVFACYFLKTVAAHKNFVSCGSLIKLRNFDYEFRLHSHDVKYGSGSNQQSVTGVETKDDVNSHWLVKPSIGEECERGEPVKCGDVIRLEHLQTSKNLHSHLFSSPMSSEQEVSAYGEKGVGDSGDNWELICSDEYWLRDSPIRLRHVDTGAYLAASGRTFGRPISGQMEIVAVSSARHGTRWVTAEGLYVQPIKQQSDHQHSEL